MKAQTSLPVTVKKKKIEEREELYFLSDSKVLQHEELTVMTQGKPV